MIFVDGMKRDALKRPGKVALRVSQGWAFGLSLAEGEWHFSAELWPKGRGSIVEDWHYLGRVVAAVGAPRELPESVKTAPNAVHHWHWDALKTRKGDSV